MCYLNGQFSRWSSINFKAYQLSAAVDLLQSSLAFSKINSTFDRAGFNFDHCVIRYQLH